LWKNGWGVSEYGFSPDGVGTNESWKIDGIENYLDNKVMTFNSWGGFEFEMYNNTSMVFRGISIGKRNLERICCPRIPIFFTIKIKGSHNLKDESGFLVLK